MASAYQAGEHDTFEYEWPEEVPRDFDGLVRKYGKYIESQVKRYNKIGRNFEDLLQHIWMKLLDYRSDRVNDHGNILEKFVEGAALKLPATMTAEEAIAFLGISDKQWENMVGRRLRELEWLPAPIKGSPYSMMSIFNTGDIELLHECGYFKKRNGGPRRRPKVSGRGFKSYLSRTIHNHFANWCRTRSRRYKEQTLEPTAVLAANSDGTYRSGIRIEDYTTWEATLVASTFNEDEIAEVIEASDILRTAFDDEGLDLGCLNKTVKGKPTPEAKRCLEVLDFVAQGYTVPEAVKAQVRSQARAVARSRARVAQMA